MHNAAYDLNAERLASDNDICGYKVTTDENVYYIRCDLRKNTYNAYIYCYDKQALQTYKDLKFVEQNYDAIDKDKFFKTTNGVMEYAYDLAFGSFDFGLSSAMSWIYFLILSVIMGIVAWIISRRTFYYT